VIFLVLAAAFCQSDVSYTDISRKFNLAPADRLMKEGKYLEAAVAYRNLMLQSADREATRVPFALALLAKGDASYAGIELRRAHMLYPDFMRLRIDPAELFGSKGDLAKAAEAATRQKTEGDAAEVNAIIAYAWYLEGEQKRAQEALDRYIQARGADSMARDLRTMVAKTGAPAPAAAAPAAAPPSPPAALIRTGEPTKAAFQFVEPEVKPRAEIFSK
jgi:hypothetical protein